MQLAVFRLQVCHDDGDKKIAAKCNFHHISLTPNNLNSHSSAPHCVFVAASDWTRVTVVVGCVSGWAFGFGKLHFLCWLAHPGDLVCLACIKHMPTASVGSQDGFLQPCNLSYSKLLDHLNRSWLCYLGGCLSERETVADVAGAHSCLTPFVVT